MQYGCGNNGHLALSNKATDKCDPNLGRVPQSPIRIIPDNSEIDL